MDLQKETKAQSKVTRQMWSKLQGGERSPFQPKTTKGSGTSHGNQSLDSNADNQPHLSLLAHSAGSRLCRPAPAFVPVVLAPETSGGKGRQSHPAIPE